MKAGLRLAPHNMRGRFGVPDDAQVVEVWHGDKMVAVIYGDDGPGVRIISKFGLVGVQLARDMFAVTTEE